VTGVDQSHELAALARDARDIAEFRTTALAVCRAMIGCDTALFSDLGRPEPLAALDVEPGNLELIAFCERNIHRYLPEMTPALERARRDGGCVDTLVYSEDERSRSRFFAEIVRTQGIHSMLVLQPRWRDQPLGLLRLQRHSARRFEQAELDVALRLLPVLELALAAMTATAGPPEVESVLTSREREIAAFVARGLTTPEIARLLGTSKLTVRNQVSRILRKARLSNRTELALWFSGSLEGALPRR
jgi:DNA-binding CsgD family transcriptional regulator